MKVFATLLLYVNASLFIAIRDLDSSAEMWLTIRSLARNNLMTHNM